MPFQRSIFIRHAGRRLSLAQWCEETGMPFGRVWSRWCRGTRDFETLFAEYLPPGRSKQITYRHRTQSLSAWAREIGMSPAALSARLKKHPVEVALAKPPGKYRRR